MSRLHFLAEPFFFPENKDFTGFTPKFSAPSPSRYRKKKSMYLKTENLRICMLSVNGSKCKLRGCIIAKVKLLQARGNEKESKDIDKL